MRRAKTQPLLDVGKSVIVSGIAESAQGEPDKSNLTAVALPYRNDVPSALLRITFGFALQLLSVFTSLSVFIDEGGTLYLWTSTAVGLGLMLWTPSERYLERYAHVASGALAYYLLDFHYNLWSTSLIITTALSNAFGQVVGEAAMRRVYPSIPLTYRDVQRPKFLSTLIMFPVLLASVAAGVPGSCGYHFLAGRNFWRTIVNYCMGHITGNIVVLYPTLVLPALWSRRPPFRSTPVIPAISGITGVVLMFAFVDYGVFAFAAVLSTFGIIASVSTHLDQWSACLMQTVATTLILGLSAGRRGPFRSIYVDGESRDVQLTAQLASATATAFGAFVCLSSTRLRLLRASEKIALDKAEEMIETQAMQLSRVGHDMLNNSALVSSMSVTLADSLPVDGPARNQLKIIQAAISMNGTLVRDMADAFRPDGKAATVCRTEVDMREFMEMHAHFARALTRMAEKSLETSLDMEGTMTISTDKDRLHQVLSNLIGNAVKYTLSGSIVLRVSRRRYRDDSIRAAVADTAIIQVIDTGIGIDADDVPKIFATLYRCAQGAKIASGTGLGLSSVLKSCRLLGATITAESPGINQGSTFTLELPHSVVPDVGVEKAPIQKQEPTGQEQEASASEVTSVAGLRALVVDDSRIIREMMKRYLVNLGCDVVDLESGEKAKEALVQAGVAGSFDVIFTDLHMGTDCCTGTDLISDIRLGRLRWVARDTPCVLCSGLEVTMEDYGENTYFMWKPFTQVEVADALNSAKSSRRGNKTSPADEEC